MKRFLCIALVFVMLLGLCGFDKDISLTVDSQSYAIARDTCSTIQDLGNLRYFNVTQEEIDYIHALFEKYDGSFPCI